MSSRLASLIVLTALTLGASGCARTDPDRIAGVDVEGTRFRIQLASGKVFAGADLVGSTLTLDLGGQTGGAAGNGSRVYIDSVKVDPMDPMQEILLYHFLSVDPATGARQEMCGPNSEGERWGFPLQGQWDAQGTHVSDRGFTLTCSDGAQGKCVRFGYKPWKMLGDSAQGADYHQACVRMVTADYCGGGGTTRDGILIDYYDRLGIQRADPDAVAQGVKFEARWGTEGAICVAHTRVPENITLEQLGEQCPRLRGKLGPDTCTTPDNISLQDGALIYNGSR